MEEEVKEVAETMSDYAKAEKEERGHSIGSVYDAEGDRRL